MHRKYQQNTFKATNFLLVFVVFFLLNLEVFASDKFITIKGNQRVDRATILSNLDVYGLNRKSKRALEKSLKNLYASGLFLESKIYFRGKITIVEVTENPIISEVKFVGNDKIENDALQSEISLKKRSVFTKSKLENDLKRINEIYLKSGRFLTKIDPKIIQKEQNRIELIFDIYEGKRAKISEIYFIGNEAFSDSKLMDEISTKESKWYKFLSSSDIYDSDRIEFDKEKLRRFYGSRGYADFVAISAIAQITPKKDRFFINFLLEEGIKYNVGKIDIVNYIKKFDASILEKEILIDEGDVYNLIKIEKTVDKMVEEMSQKSYAFAHIEPVLKRNREEKIIDINFVIRETPRIYIDQITISGNTRTKDEVIRRELRLREGDPYNITKINRSKQRIENLGFFETVNFDTKRVGNSDKVEIDVKVKEKKTGELTLGIGYSTVDKLTANAGIRERNLFGTGQELGVNIQKSFARLSNQVNYTKPYFMGRSIDVGVDLFQFQLGDRNTLVYDQNTVGFTVRGDYSITEYLNHQVRYSLRDEKISNINNNASISIQNLRGDFVTSSIGQTLLYDKRDNRLNPTSGYFISLGQDYAGLGGDIEYLKHEGSAGYYVPIVNEDYILKFLVRGGVIDGIGQDVRSNFGFFLGGNNFRGFEFAGIGPRAKVNGSFVNGDIIGGNMYYVGSAEFMFPLGLPKELGINGILFSDNGTVKGVDQINRRGAEIADSGSLRSSYGFSIAWSSPLGPIRLDFAKAAKKEDYDRTESFRFNFGTTF